uniref:free fatty acid receptor 2-like n=1 Tax=Podarcis muralis TaxID=64176 RepID=UPI00109F3BE1|nr:free fatty acid receptor 2-like [Podarcis muralis]
MAHKGVVLAFYIFTFLTGLPSNLLACYTFFRKVSQKPVPIDILLLNLTVSDITLLLFLPFKMAEATWDMTWHLPVFLCPLTNFCFYSSIYISTLFLMGVSVERYLCVLYPVKYKLNRRPIYAIAASLFFWLLAYSHCSIVYIVQNRNTTMLPSDKNFSCYEKFSSSQLQILLPVRLEISLLLFWLPFAITLFCYINVIRILASLPNIPSHKKKRAMGLALVTLLIFTICFAPYNTSHIVGFIQKESPSWRVDAFLLSALNTTLDPVLFFFSSTDIRRTFSSCWVGMSKSLWTMVSACCSPCCKVPGDGGGGEEDAGAGQTVANLPSELAQARDSTFCTSRHKPGILLFVPAGRGQEYLSTENILKDVPCT